MHHRLQAAVFRDPKIEIPENHLLLEKEGASILKNVCIRLFLAIVPQPKDKKYRSNS